MPDGTRAVHEKVQSEPAGTSRLVIDKKFVPVRLLDAPQKADWGADDIVIPEMTEPRLTVNDPPDMSCPEPAELGLLIVTSKVAGAFGKTGTGEVVSETVGGKAEPMAMESLAAPAVVATPPAVAVNVDVVLVYVLAVPLPGRTALISMVQLAPTATEPPE